MIRTVSLVFVAAAMLSAANANPAHALDAAPDCSAPSVLKKIVSRFNQTERLYWKHRGHRMSHVAASHNHGGKGYGDSPLHRHRCHGTAHFTDGKPRTIHYLIEERAGFAGVTWNVEYCVRGLDPWYYYDGRCRSLRW